MKKYHLSHNTFAALAVLALLSGCAKEPASDTPTPTETVVSINVSVAQEVESKAALRDAAFDNGEQIGLYVVAWRKPTVQGILENKYNYVDNALATFNSATPVWTISPTIFYPTVAVDIYGYAPYLQSFAPTNNPEAFEFTVQADQHTSIKDNDLLTALKPQATSSTTALDMTFYHRLSRVAVQFKLPASFKGKTIQQVASVTLKGIRPTAVVDLTTPYTYDVEGTATGGTYPKPATVKAASAPVDITPNAVQTSTPGSTANDGTEYFIYEALVPPQSLADKAGFVEIVADYDDGTHEVFYYVNAGTPTFVAAKSTLLNLSFQKDYTILLGTVAIAPWASATGTSGEVVQREVFNKFPITLPGASATQVVFVTLTTQIGTAAEVDYLLPATHTANTDLVQCSFDGTQNSPEFYAFNITKVEWFDANKSSLGSKLLPTPVRVAASGSVVINLQ